jgi:hypothetical protein
MKIEFADGSFLEALPNEENDTVSIIMCGVKDYNQFTMSVSDLDVTQVEQLVEFLAEWKKNI